MFQAPGFALKGERWLYLESPAWLPAGPECPRDGLHDQVVIAQVQVAAQACQDPTVTCGDGLKIGYAIVGKNCAFLERCDLPLEAENVPADKTATRGGGVRALRGLSTTIAHAIKALQPSEQDQCPVLARRAIPKLVFTASLGLLGIAYRPLATSQKFFKLALEPQNCHATMTNQHHADSMVTKGHACVHMENKEIRSYLARESAFIFQGTVPVPGGEDWRPVPKLGEKKPHPEWKKGACDRLGVACSPREWPRTGDTRSGGERGAQALPDVGRARDGRQALSHKCLPVCVSFSKAVTQGAPPNLHY